MLGLLGIGLYAYSKRTKTPIIEVTETLQGAGAGTIVSNIGTPFVQTYKPTQRDEFSNVVSPETITTAGGTITFPGATIQDIFKVRTQYAASRGQYNE